MRYDSLRKQAYALLGDEFGFNFSTVPIETVCTGEDHAGNIDFAASAVTATRIQISCRGLAFYDIVM